MGSAGLKYAADGAVAWDEIWGSFCDLAMACGPPHRGTLLEPGRLDEIEKHSAVHQEVVGEICRGISMVTGLTAEPSDDPGWVRVYCDTVTMAGWLTRAIVMENVSARCEGHILSLPAGPSFRVEKEIKNVITAIAKTCHYWQEHTSPSQHQAIANLFARMDIESPLIQPACSGPSPTTDFLSKKMAQVISDTTGFRPSSHKYTGWLGLEFLELMAAIRIMRLLVVSNVLSRREGTVVFVPVDPSSDPNGDRVTRIVQQLTSLPA